MGLVLALVSHLPTYCARCFGRHLTATADRLILLTPPYRELAGMTWGVAGRRTDPAAAAGVARAFGCRGVDLPPSSGRQQCQSRRPCCESDIVTIHTPLTEETRGMIGKKISWHYSDFGAILVNMARGAVTDEAAVAEAILAGRLGGFGADVYSTEPFRAEHPFSALLGMPQVCLTPHMSWGALEARGAACAK